MWKLWLKWLPIFCWIVGATLLLPGIAIAFYHSLKCIFGVSNDDYLGYSENANYLRSIEKIRRGPVKRAIGLIPLCLLGIGFGGGLFWSLSMVFSARTALTNTLVGGLLGLIAALAILPQRPAYLLLGFFWFVIVSDWSHIINGQILQRFLMIGGFWAMRYLIARLALLVFPFVKRIDQKVSSGITSLLILLRFKPIICNNCLRYTDPFKSRYENGKRYCEYCRGEVELTREPGKVIFIFGDFPQKEPKGRIFLCSNPTLGASQSDSASKLFFRTTLDLNRRPQPVDVSEVYIDTRTCDPHLIERFITYILHDPPEHGLESLRIFYRGELDDLEENLKNALLNNFDTLQRLTGITPYFLRE